MAAAYFALGLMDTPAREEACSPTGRHVPVPTAETERKMRAAQLGQTTLTAWQAAVEQRQRDSWLPLDQAVPATVSPVDFQVYTGATAPTVHSGHWGQCNGKQRQPSCTNGTTDSGRMQTGRTLPGWHGGRRRRLARENDPKRREAPTS
eukprot:427036-Rhodomonas_salina.1